MKELTTEIEIRAKSSKVWEVLMDCTSYPDWNPLIRKVTGDFDIDSKPRLYVKLPYGIRANSRLKMLKVNPGEELRWSGKLLGIGFLFAGEHSFILKASGEGSTKLFQCEKFTGLLSSLFWTLLGAKIRQSYIGSNEALKELCEK